MSCRHPGCPSSGAHGDIVVNVLLLEHVLVRELYELYVPIDVLQQGRLAKEDELTMDEAILDVVELVDVLPKTNIKPENTNNLRTIIV
jgi:hypothetical protein